MAGRMHESLMKLHKEYGTVVRVAPDELSFSSPDAWEEVYGRYKAGKRKENMKPGWYASRDSNDILGAEHGDHGRIRKILNFGFTASAMIDQEPAIAGFVDLLFERLRARAGDTSIDVWKWYLYTLFDITGNLACKHFVLLSAFRGVLFACGCGGLKYTLATVSSRGRIYCFGPS